MPNGRCRMHGGTSPGAPLCNQRALKHGLYGREMRDVRAAVRALAQWNGKTGEAEQQPCKFATN